MRRTTDGDGCAIGRLLAVSAAVVALGGCASTPSLMPTPNLYTETAFNPFNEVPAALQGDRIDVIYITDRAPEAQTSADASDHMEYGWHRSRSAAFGVAQVQIGDGELSWDELVAESRSADRSKSLPLSLPCVRELARFAPTPPSLLAFDTALNDERLAEAREGELAAEARFREVLAAQLAKTPRKDVYLFVHGFEVTFPSSIFVIAELWHFLGREGVPIAYTWPAGRGGLRAYEYTNQSVQFTIYHFKQALRLIASCPEVEHIHIIAHSRGTAVTSDGVRDLVLESRCDPDLLASLKLGTCVFAAADLDMDAVIERNVTERIGSAVQAVAIYTFPHDEALALSNWLSDGSMRLGDVRSRIFDPQELAALRSSPRLQLIDARISDPGFWGHSYFHKNPAVSSDLVLFLRYGLEPDSGDGRPLGVGENGFWTIDNSYPGTFDAPWFARIERLSASPRD